MPAQAKTRTVVRKSYAFLFFAAGAWLLWAAFFPLYKLFHFVAAAALSVAVGNLGQSMFPDQVYTEQVPIKAPEPEKTGNPELDALIVERDKAVAEMRTLNDQIPGERISALIDTMEATTKLIFSSVITSPEKISQIRRFLDYYLPTSIKLMQTYAQMDAAGVKTTNITETKTKIENALDTINKAFKKQLESLFIDDIMDISAEITVMENLLEQEGLLPATAMEMTED